MGVRGLSTRLWEAIHEESKIHFDLSKGKCYSVDDRHGKCYSVDDRHGKCYSVDDRHGWWQTDLCQKIKEPSLKVLRTLFLLGATLTVN